MKFEKFLKQTGTHGEVIELNESEKWLVCDGVGMVIPHGVDNLLGTANSGRYTAIVRTISNAELDDRLTLNRAVLLDPAGNAKSIYRVFETVFGDTVGIINGDYGLLEKSDVLGYGEIELDEGEPVVKYILVYDKTGVIQGFITGSNEF